MGWITTILASGPARKALGLVLAVLTIVLFLLNLRRAGERAGRLAERLSTTEKIHDIQRQMLDAASVANRPVDIGLSPSHHQETVLSARFIRRRYTLLDLLAETDMLDLAVEAIFSGDGL